jgi:hypothetical protein
VRDTRADDNQIRFLKNLAAMGAQLDINTDIPQLHSCVPQCRLIGGVGCHNSRALLMQEAGGRKPGAAKTNNDYIFIFQLHVSIGSIGFICLISLGFQIGNNQLNPYN